MRRWKQFLHDRDNGETKQTREKPVKLAAVEIKTLDN
jgi:hypothetical protein